MNDFKLLIVAAGLGFAGACFAANTVFQWTDDNGVVQYTDQPPTDRTYKTIKSTSAPPSAARAQEALAEQRKQQAEAATEAEGKMAFQEEQRKRDELAQQVREENCTSGQSNLKTLTEHSRIRVMGTDGEVRYLTEEERQDEIRKAQEMIDTNCG